jgi:hypothetical protein
MDVDPVRKIVKRGYYCNHCDRELANDLEILEGGQKAMREFWSKHEWGHNAKI